MLRLVSQNLSSNTVYTLPTEPQPDPFRTMCKPSCSGQLSVAPVGSRLAPVAFIGTWPCMRTRGGDRSKVNGETCRLAPVRGVFVRTGAPIERGKSPSMRVRLFYLSIYISVHLSIYLSTYLSISKYLPTYLFGLRVLARAIVQNSCL